MNKNVKTKTLKVEFYDESAQCRKVRDIDDVITIIYTGSGLLVKRVCNQMILFRHKTDFKILEEVDNE